MPESKNSVDKARRFFDELWQRGDPWELESSSFEADKYESQLKMLGDRRYQRILEIGCAAGHFTRMLAPLCDELVALDVSPAAIARSKASEIPAHVEFLAADVMQFDHEANQWDLIVLSETIYYLGWIHTFFDVSWLAGRLFDSLLPHGRLLLVNSYGGESDYLMRPWIIDTYRDLFLNLGLELERTTTFDGMKNGVRILAPLSLFCKPHDVPPATSTNDRDADTLSHVPGSCKRNA
jgi:SAM-dependent methyltransferase